MCVVVRVAHFYLPQPPEGAQQGSLRHHFLVRIALGATHSTGASGEAESSGQKERRVQIIIIQRFNAAPRAES